MTGADACDSTEYPPARWELPLYTLIFAVILATGIAMIVGCSFNNQRWHTDCKILHKDVLYDTSGSNGSTSTTRTKRLSTSCGEFNVDDSVAGGFSSYDRWAALQEGRTYDIRTGGYRIGFADQFPVVIDIKPSP